jgi:PEP-CTERM motif
VSSHRRGVHRRRIRHHKCFAKAAIAIALLPLLVFAAYFISKRPHTYRYNFPGAQDLEWAGGNASENLAALAGRVAPAPPVRRGRLVYPYSVIPGGVRDGNELREAIQRDRAAARHYAGFDFQKAHIVQLKSPKLVFLSYRLRDKIYWTRKQIKLSEGERLITDGKVAARTRCANQVSVLPQAAVSTEEPLAEQLEDPFGVGGSATQIDFPGSFESALLRRTPPGLGGEGPGSGLFGSPFGGGGPGLSPPPIPSGCAKPPCSTTPTPPPPPPPPAPVPEPGSILLVSFGLAGIYFRYRKRASKN